MTGRQEIDFLVLTKTAEGIATTAMQAARWTARMRWPERFVVQSGG